MTDPIREALESLRLCIIDPAHPMFRINAELALRQLTAALALHYAVAQDTARLSKLQAMLVDNPTLFQVAIRRLETTGQFLVKVSDSPSASGLIASGCGVDLRDAIDRVGTNLRHM